MNRGLQDGGSTTTRFIREREANTSQIKIDQCRHSYFLQNNFLAVFITAALRSPIRQQYKNGFTEELIKTKVIATFHALCEPSFVA